MYQGLNIAVIIPALNEEAAIGVVLRDLPAWVDDVIVADNGSTDRTAEVARSLGARVVSEPRRGYGSACLAAMAALDHADVVVFMDADHSDRPQEMAGLLQPITDGRADLVIGSRVLGQCEPGALTPQQRFGNALACLLIRLIHGARFTDLGPFRAVRRSALDLLRMDDRGYGWTCQMQVRAARLGLRTAEIPVSYHRRIGKSKISGTLKGVIGAGSKILFTVFRESSRAPGLSARARPARLATLSTGAGAAAVETLDHPVDRLSVVIPALNEEDKIGAAIRSALTLGERNVEVIVADGGSSDRTAEVARACGAVVVRSDRGRAIQMNAGAAAAGGAILLFLHADSRLPHGYARRVRRLLSADGTAAGAFALAIGSSDWVLNVIASAANLRSRLMQTPFGDQAIFLRRDVFQRLGGYPSLPIMEDLELTRRLRQIGAVRIANAVVTTSGRRWRQFGAWRTTVLHQILLCGHFFGISPDRLYHWRESGIILHRRALLCGRDGTGGLPSRGGRA